MGAAEFGAIDEVMAIYCGPKVDPQEAVALLLLELRDWCKDEGVDFARALNEGKRAKATTRKARTAEQSATA